jgi:hypothetical protein
LLQFEASKCMFQKQHTFLSSLHLHTVPTAWYRCTERWENQLDKKIVHLSSFKHLDLTSTSCHQPTSWTRRKTPKSNPTRRLTCTISYPTCKTQTAIVTGKYQGTSQKSVTNRLQDWIMV